MTGSREKAVIVSCPRDAYRKGAQFTMPDLMDMVLHFSLPSGTEFTWRGKRYLYYHDVRYELDAEGYVVEGTAMIVKQGWETGYHPKWVAVIS